MKTSASFDENYFYIEPNFVANLKTFLKNKDQFSNDKSEAMPLEIVHQFEKKLGLSYISVKTAEGNLCFVNNDGIRSDYKQTFTNEDLLHYIEAFLPSQTNSETLKITYPKDTQTFWKLVESVGSKTR